MIPAAALEWFDAADQGLVLIFGNSGRRRTQEWLRARRAERGGRQVSLSPDEDERGQRAALLFSRARRWDIDALFCDDCMDGTVVTAALEAAVDGTLVVLSAEGRDVVEGLSQLLARVPPGQADRCRTIVSRQLRLALSERSVARADGKGTVAAYEVLEVTLAQRNCIRSNMIHQLAAQMAVGGTRGAKWWPDALADLVLDGTCSPEAALAASHAAGELERALLRAGAPSGRASSEPALEAPRRNSGPE